MKMRKLLAVVVISLLVLASSAVAAEKTKVTIMITGDPGTTPNPEFLEYCAQVNPDIELEYIIVPTEEFLNKLTNMIIGGKAPDIHYLPQGYYEEWARDGFLLNIDEYIAKDEILSKHIMPAERERSTIDGRFYGLGVGWAHIHMFYSKPALAQAAVPQPSRNAQEAWTWDEFVANLKKLTVRSSSGTEQWGLIWPVFHQLRFDALLATFGTSFLVDGEYNLDGGQVKTAVESMLQLSFEDQVMPIPGTMDFFGMVNYMIAGSVAIFIDGSFRHRQLDSAGFSDYGIATLPKGIGQELPSTVTWSDFYVISSQTEHPEAAYRVLSTIQRFRWGLDDPRPTYALEGMVSAKSAEYWELAELFTLVHSRPSVVIPANESQVLTNGITKIFNGSASVSELVEINRQLNVLLNNRGN